MRSLNFRQALEEIRKRLNLISKSENQENIILGVAGYVASGKSRFSQKLQHDAATILHKEVIYLPFDLWINMASLNSSTYAGRFLLDDFRQAINCISRGEYFFVPRYDLSKKIGLQKPDDQLTTQQMIWNGKTFIGFSQDSGIQTLLGSKGLYVEVSSGYLYSLFQPTIGSLFLIDGTLVFPAQVTQYYHLKIFVQAIWPLRVARMIRRFNRKEVFGITTQSMSDYVGFLVDEAKSCADQEIKQQINEDVILVESVPETLSNYLDLIYLREYAKHPNLPQWASLEEVEEAIQLFTSSIRNEHDPKRLEFLRQELLALMESKHLLALANIDQVLSEFAKIIL